MGLRGLFKRDLVVFYFAASSLLFLSLEVAFYEHPEFGFSGGDYGPAVFLTSLFPAAWLLVYLLSKRAAGREVASGGTGGAEGENTGGKDGGAGDEGAGDGPVGNPETADTTRDRSSTTSLGSGRSGCSGRSGSSFTSAGGTRGRRPAYSRSSCR
ncbi:MAG: hypothetical protein ACTSU5_11660 [Promethearchaeota archaeon]